MMQYESFDIKGHIVEYYEEEHEYLVDGLLVPSITQILKNKFGNKYDGVSKEVLNRAAALGTNMHQAIQEYEEKGLESELKELRNYKFLKKHYKWECVANEVPVILFKDEVPIVCGRIDEVAKLNGEMGLLDFKRTSVLDKEYLAYQLNLYRIAYQQCYDTEIKFLKGLHLREDVRKCINIPINENEAQKLLNEFIGGNKDE